MMSLHNSKKEALLTLCNCVSTCSIEHIEDLASGEFFQSTIETIFSEFSKGIEKNHSNVDSVDHQDNGVHENMLDGVNENVLDGVNENVLDEGNESVLDDVQEKILVTQTEENNQDLNVVQSNENSAINSEVNADSNIVIAEDKTVSPRRTRSRDSVGQPLSEEPIKSIGIKRTRKKDSMIQPLPKETLNSSGDKKPCKTNCIVQPLSEEPCNASSDKENILQRFQFIEKFIDDKYNLKSAEIISYDQCLKSHELELAKVGWFILSEIVKHFVLMNNKQLQTLSHVDIRMQEDLEECLQLFITERDKLSKKEIEKILSKHAKYKALSPFKISCVTPQRNCRSKYKKQSPSTPVSEEVFSNSPLISFFESPVFKKEDIIIKNKEIEKTKKSQLQLDLYCEDLEHEIEELKQKLQEKDKEIQRLKTTIDSMRETYEAVAEKECTSLICKEKEEKLFEELKYISKQLVYHRDEHSLLRTVKEKCDLEAKRLEAIIVEQEAQLKELKHFRDVKYTEVLKNFSENLLEKDEEIKQLQEELIESKNKLEDLARNESMSRAKLSEAVKALEKGSKSPELGENIGKFVEGKILRSHRKKNHKEYLADLGDLSNTTEKERFRNSTESFNNINELNTEDPDELLSLDSSDVASKQSVSSLLCEVKSPDVKETEALLWKGFVLQPEKESNFEDVDNNSDSKLKEISSQTDIDKTNCIKEIDNLYVPEKSRNKSQVLERLCIALKKLSSNGICKIIDPLIEKLQSEYKSFKMSSTNGSKIHDSEALLERIVECIEVYANSHDTQDKAAYNSSTSIVNGNEIPVETTKKSIEEQSTEESTNKLAEEESNELKKKKQEVYFLRKTVYHLKKQYQDSLEQIVEKNLAVKDLQKYSSEQNQRLSEKTKKLSDAERRLTHAMYMNKKIRKEYATSLSKELEMKNKFLSEKQSLQDKIDQLNKSKKLFEKHFRAFKEDRRKLLERIKSLEVEKANHVCVGKESHSCVIKVENVFSSNNSGDSKPVCVSTTENSSASSEGESAIPQRNVKQEELSSNGHSDTVSSEWNMGLVKDNANESVSSGALFNKSHLRFESQDEEDYLNHSSLADIKKDYSVERAEELKRRNSMLPFNLQSSYALENLKSSSDNLYVKNRVCGNIEDIQEEKVDSDVEFKNKKRKLNDMESDKDIKCVQSTPKLRMKRVFKTPPSQVIGKLLTFRRRTGFIKPKP